MMFPSKLGIFASLALAASAVLIPPTISSEDVGYDNALETLAINPLKRSVALECPGCAFATKEGKAFTWKEGAGNTFVLDFEIGGEGDSLNIAGFQLFPPTFNNAIASFHVSQIDPQSGNALQLQVTGSQSRFDGAETISQAGTELLPLTLQITSLEGEPVNPPELRINLLKDSRGRLMIASFETAQTEENSLASDKKDCNEWPLLCEWKDIIAERIEKMKKMGKGCNKRPHGQDGPVAHDGFHGKPPHRFRPGRPHDRPHHRPHHHGHGPHGHHRHHRVHMFLRRALFTILIPIVIGIFAGTVTYLVGMALGCLIAMVVAKVHGRGYERIALEEDVEQAEEEHPKKVEDEKEEFAELPAYDAPPVYEEADVKKSEESE